MKVIDNRLDLEILRALLPCPLSSVHKVINELKKNKTRVKKLNRSTVERHLLSLEKHGFVSLKKGFGTRKNGQTSKKTTIEALLTYKGLFKLVLDAELTDTELMLIVQKNQDSFMKYKTQLTELPLIKKMPVEVLRKSFQQMRSRINLEYFDEEYAVQLFFDNAIIGNVLEEYEKALPQIMDIKSRNKVKKEEAIKTLKKLPKDFLETYLSLYEYMRERQTQWNEKIAYIKPSANYLKTHRAVIANAKELKNVLME